MDQHQPYSIGFTSLKPGEHLYEYTLGSTFFEENEDSVIRQGNVTVIVTLLKEERMMDLHFDIKGSVRVPCDRCNELVDLDIEGTERLIVKLGDRYYEESEDIQVIPEASHQFDLSPFLYEYIHLLLPYRKVHPDDENGNSMCDPEVLEKLNELNEHHEPDPRWDALKNLNS